MSRAEQIAAECKVAAEKAGMATPRDILAYTVGMLSKRLEFIEAGLQPPATVGENGMRRCPFCGGEAVVSGWRRWEHYPTCTN